MAELLETVMTALFDIALLFPVIYSAKGRAANSGTRLVAHTFVFEIKKYLKKQ